MHKEDVLKFRVGKCGSCSLTMRFWPVDGSEVSCPNCGCAHEVEVDLAENLKTGEKKEIVLLVPVSRENNIKRQVSEN
jgi:hypothetical protein